MSDQAAATHCKPLFARCFSARSCVTALQCSHCRLTTAKSCLAPRPNDRDHSYSSGGDPVNCVFMLFKLLMGYIGSGFRLLPNSHASKIQFTGSPLKSVTDHMFIGPLFRLNLFNCYTLVVYLTYGGAVTAAGNTTKNGLCENVLWEKLWY